MRQPCTANSCRRVQDGVQQARAQPLHKALLAVAAKARCQIAGGAGLAQLPDAGRVILRFGAVDYAARVWVNGRLAVTHEGGHTPFQADVTHLLSLTGRQVITVRAEDDPHSLTQPRGKHDWKAEPHEIWYRAPLALADGVARTG